MIQSNKDLFTTGKISLVIEEREIKGCTEDGNVRFYYDNSNKE